MIIIGHRGARNEAPENTLPGFRHLRSLGIHHVELDVRLSADDQLIVIHDQTLDRTTNTTGSVRALSAGALAGCDATCRFTPALPAVRALPDQDRGVPRLQRVLQEWPALASIQLEVKTTDRDSLKIIADRLAQMISELQIQTPATVTSMDVQFLHDMQHRHGAIKRGYVAERFVRNPIEHALRLGCHLLAINWRRLSEADVQAAHRAGLQVSAWTVNDPRIALRLKDWGVDSLITDVPSRMQGLGIDA